MKCTVIGCFCFIIKLLDSTTQSHVGVFFLSEESLSFFAIEEVEICSTFQTHSNIYTVHDVNIIEQYIGAAENSKYATKQNSEKVRLLKGGS